MKERPRILEIRDDRDPVISEGLRDRGEVGASTVLLDIVQKEVTGAYIPMNIARELQVAQD